MNDYPLDISEEENAGLKHPFLKAALYDSVKEFQDGPKILIRKSDERLTKKQIRTMIDINRQIAARTNFNKPQSK
ncbi:hypothetical protein CCDG5_1022 [[Clostridium] cellulosi]|jgi:hypothetical protein|uniref:Uncharacterized protein n=1 Tax=[Clostridium] cellulosi TaxID=29343 RepID=A0A078KSM1_9FIRM|nr:MAG: hypothetical protein DIU81_07290 [[Clostridium] cellulosi]CDZ24139.1 hypothetical protein CCDG5_1022 [[Clostridium] cellulosi]